MKGVIESLKLAEKWSLTILKYDCQLFRDKIQAQILNYVTTKLNVHTDQKLTKHLRVGFRCV